MDDVVKKVVKDNISNFFRQTKNKFKNYLFSYLNQNENKPFLTFYFILFVPCNKEMCWYYAYGFLGEFLPTFLFAVLRLAGKWAHVCCRIGGNFLWKLNCRKKQISVYFGSKFGHIYFFFEQISVYFGSVFWTYHYFFEQISVYFGSVFWTYLFF